LPEKLNKESFVKVHRRLICLKNRKIRFNPPFLRSQTSSTSSAKSFLAKKRYECKQTIPLSLKLYVYQNNFKPTFARWYFNILYAEFPLDFIPKHKSKLDQKIKARLVNLDNF